MIRRILTLIMLVPVLGYCGLAVTRVSAAKREAKALQKTLEPTIEYDSKKSEWALLDYTETHAALK